MNKDTDYGEDKEIYEKWIEGKPWLEFYDKETPKEIEIPKIPLYKFLDDAYKIASDHPSMIFMGNKISYRMLHEESERFGRALVDKFNIKKGDKVAIYLPNYLPF